MSKGAEDELDRVILESLRQRADAGESSKEDDDALISAAVAAHLGVVQLESKRKRKSVTPWLAATGLLVAAAAAALWLVPENSGDTDHAAQTEAGTDAPTQAMWVLEDQGTPLEGVATAAARELCGTRNDTRACLSPGSRGNFEPDGNLRLDQGTARVEAQWPIVLSLAGVRVQATTDAAHFSATRLAQQWGVAVESGTVTVTGPDGSSQVLEAGETAGSEAPPELAELAEPAGQDPEPTPPADEAHPSENTKPAPSVDALLKLARSQRAASDFTASAQTYEQLVRAYPNSSKVRATLVSLAQLYQGPLDDPAKALGHFDRYLERGGPLAEEAHYGKIRALRSLGRAAAAKTELDAFLRSYPDSAHVDALRGQ